MPLCKPTIVANSKLQWVTIKQDTHLALQECKIVGKSWWSSGDVSWGYRVIITATETQIAYAGDITQIVTDWEVLQRLVSEEPPLDPESSPAASAEVIERMLQRRWDEKQGGKEKQDGAESQSGKEKEKEAIVTDSSSSSSSSSSSTNTLSAEVKPTFEKRSSSRIFFRSGSTSTAIKRLAVGASESSPFPGIPLHREGQPSPRLGGGGPNSPRARAATTLESPRSAALGRSRDEESTITKPIPEAASAQNDQSGREREMREKYERSLHALKDKVAAPQHDDHYRVYVDCINGILHELQAVKNIDGKGSPDEAQTTAEVLCQLSRTSLDAARMLVAQQKAARERVGVTVQVTAAEEEGSSSRPPTEDEQQKAKEGQGDAEVGSGDTEKAMNSSSAVDPSEQAKQEVDKNISGDDAKKRLQRCVELFTVANKSLASMTQPPSDVAQE